MSTAMENQAEPIVTDDDIDAGFKDVPCVTRGGCALVIRLKPVSHRHAQKLLAETLEKCDDLIPLYRSLPPDVPAEATLDRLSVESLMHLNSVAWALSLPLNFTHIIGQ